jgi:hypothetical protein
MRIRTIKPELWQNEGLATLDVFTFLLAIGLLNYADDEGYFNANPALIRAALFPLRDVSGMIPVGLHGLEKLGYIRIFPAENGRSYGHITNFLKHQVINKSKCSKLKELAEKAHATGAVLSESGSQTELLPSGSGIREQGSGIREPGTGSMEVKKGAGARKRAGSRLPREEDSSVADRMLALNSLFNRRASTRWSEKEFTAFTEAGLHEFDAADFDEQMAIAAAYYSASKSDLDAYWKQPDKDIRRTSLLTLLNNWGCELDRAQAFMHWRNKKSEQDQSARG